MKNTFVVLAPYIKEGEIRSGAWCAIRSFTTESTHDTKEQAQARADLLNASPSRESAFGKMSAFVAEYGTDTHWYALSVRRVL